MGIKDFARVTDLFVEGTEVVVGEDAKGPVLLWVNKLNSFEMEEARRDGATARSRLILALKEVGTPDSLQFEANLVEMDAAALRTELVSSQTNDFLVEAVEGIRRDPDWADRLSASEPRNMPTDDAEKAALTLINEQYSVELESRMRASEAQAARDLQGLDDESLKEKYREMWREGRGLSAFTREFQRTRLYFSVRMCSATASKTGGYDHRACNGHRKRMLDSPAEVEELPGELLNMLLTAVNTISVERRDARFSQALASSSESSAPQSEVAESPVSTPVETSPEPVTTS